MTSIIPYSKAKKELSLSEKVGQLFMPAAFINDTEEEVRYLEALIRKYRIGGICFFHSRASAAANFESKQQPEYNDTSYEKLQELIHRYQTAAKVPLLIAIDAEWGLAMRIENTPQYPYAIALGAIQNGEDLIFELGKRIGLDCKKAGIHWNLAPVVDINLNPENPVIGYRSFGADRKQVTRYARAYLEGMWSAGTLNAIKHFPGHGDTTIDSHLDLPCITKQKVALLENELYPFINLQQPNVDAVMIGHLAVPYLSKGKTISASLSKEIITDFLRGELGWNGVVISDALNMRAVSKQFPGKGALEYAAFEAGTDILCFSEHIEEGIRIISQKGSTDAIEQRFKRVWELKEKAFAPPENSSSGFSTDDHDTFLRTLAKASITLLKGTDSHMASFRSEGFNTVLIGKQQQPFCNSVIDFPKNPENALLVIVPRQVKPKDNFGFTPQELEKIHHTLEKKRTILYLFGNPFVLNLLNWKNAIAVTVVYQDFTDFQDIAYAHFMGKLKASGKLPVQLKTISHEI